MVEEKGAGASEQPQPTTEEQLATLKTQLEAETTEKTKALGRMQGLEGSLKEKDRKLGEQANIETRFRGMEDMIKVLATQKIGIEEEDLTITPEKRPNIEKVFADLEAKQDKRLKDATIRAQQDAYNTEANVVWVEAQEKFKDDPESLEKIEDYLEKGKIDRAREKLAKVKEKPVETEADMKARLIKEIQADEGSRGTEVIQPAGGNSSDGDFVKDFASGKLPVTQANKERYEKIRDSY